MNEDRLDKMKARNVAMRKARDEILRRIEVWLKLNGFIRAGAGHFTLQFDDCVGHLGFQKLRRGRNVRVMCHLSRGETNDSTISGPWSDAYSCPNSPNNKRYQFRWSTREADIANASSEYCRFIEDVVIAWFKEQAAPNDIA